MPRVKHNAQHAVARYRICEYVDETFSSLRDAGEQLRIGHTRLWRAMQMTRNGPSVAVCEALADHSGRPVDYWRGRSDQ